MASSYTNNLSLPQWELDDRILVEEFNEAMHNIDEAVGLKVQMIVGSYTGDNAPERTISLGVTPKAVFVCDQRGSTGIPSASNFTLCGGLALPNNPVEHVLKAVEIVAGGFKVFSGKSGSTYVRTNDSNFRFNYVAFY